MANTTAIRVALVRKLLTGGHRRRVEHILAKLRPDECCAMLQLLPDREARSVASILIGPSGGPAEQLDALSPAVIGGAVRRLDADWAASVLRRLTAERLESVFATLSPEEVGALRGALDRRFGARRVRWPWSRREPPVRSLVGAAGMVGLFVGLFVLALG